MSIRSILMFSLTLFMIFATLWIRSNVVNMEYRLGNLEKQKKALVKERESLMAEKASLTAFTKLDRNSEFIFPDRTRVIYITSSEASLTKASFSLKK